MPYQEYLFKELIDYCKANPNYQGNAAMLVLLYTGMRVGELASMRQECGVNPEVVMLWAGHESDIDVKTSKVDRGYTTYSEEYLLGEIHKVEYDL